MIQLITDNLHWFWFALAVLFTIIEGFTLALSTVWFAIGALVLVFLSFLDIPLAYQAIVFLVISIVLMLLTRPVALKYLYKKQSKTNVDSLIGKTALVIAPISRFEKGQIKINGSVWTAKTADETELTQGSECVITAIEGVTAIVAVQDTAHNSDQK